MTKLNGILESLTDVTVSAISVSGDKLFPHAALKLVLKPNGTKGYFNVCYGNLTVIIISLRNQDGSWRNSNYSTHHDSSERIVILTFENYEIHFRYESNS